MLTRLIIKNFQCHADEDIEFYAEPNVLIGRSDVGKSAIFRALRWVFLNQPRGASFIRHGETDVEVTVHVDGHVVTRRRKGTENTYTLDGVVFKTVGNGVPEPVKNLLNVTEINFQSQHDPPFWLSATDAEVARNLSQLVDLQIMSDSVSANATQMASVKAQLSAKERDFAKLEDDAKALAWTTEANNQLTEIESLEASRQHVLNEREKVRGLLASVAVLESSIAKSKEMLDEVVVIGKQAQQVRSAESSLAALLTLKQQTQNSIQVVGRGDPTLTFETDYLEIKASQGSNNKLAQLASAVRAATRTADLARTKDSSLAELLQSASVLTEKRSEYAVICGVTNRTRRIESRVADMRLELDGLEGEIRDAFVVCPACGRPVEKN